MAFDFASAKKSARRAVHDTFAVDALYKAPGMSSPVSLRVRYYDKLGVEQAADGSTTYLEGITSIAFDREELLAKQLLLKPNDRVTLIAYGLTFDLATKQPIDGPIKEIWNVVTSAKPALVSP